MFLPLTILIGVAAVAYGAALMLARDVERRELSRQLVGPTGIVSGADPIHLDAGPPAVVLLHGAGDTPQSLAYLAAYLHERGYTVDVPLLPGHGRSLREFSRSSAAAWLDAARSAYTAVHQHHPWTAVIGQSMGGALAVQVAAACELPALVLLAPYLSMPRFLWWAAHFSLLWGALLAYPPSNDERSVHDAAERAKSLGHRFFPPRALRALAATVRRASRVLPQVSAPTLMIQSPNDNRISVTEAHKTFDRLGSRDKRLVWVQRGGHVLSVDSGREEVFALVADWLHAHGGAPAIGGRSLPINS